MSSSASSGSADKARHFPSTLSGGERQRVAIARADREPAGRAPRRRTDRRPRHAATARTALALLEDLNRRGQTILLVTHDEHLAAGRAHRIVRLVDGAIAGDRAARMVA